MTEEHRKRLLTARAFAAVFVLATDCELDGIGYSRSDDAAEQLKAALEALESEE